MASQYSWRFPVELPIECAYSHMMTGLRICSSVASSMMRSIVGYIVLTMSTTGPARLSG